MNIKALITSLAILGSSSAAMARPVTFSASAEASWHYGTRPTRPAPAPIVRDHRTPPPVVYNTRVYPRPIHGDLQYHQPDFLLANDLRFNSGETRKFVTIEAGKLRQLSVRSQSGAFLLKQLRVDFGNGEYQIIRNIDRVLSNGAAYSADLDGNNRNVTRVIVYGEKLSQGWYGNTSAAIDITGR